MDDAFESVGFVGQQSRTQLAQDIAAKVLLRQARDVVLLSGSTGAGKEMVAATCHEAARTCLDRQGDLVTVNCANLQGGLFESELFGHRKGAYTGADRDYEGLVGKAQGGTLVLDEIQSLARADQARLLRFLGERECRAVGSDKSRTSDALIILSTNRDLRDMVDRGEFRRDVLDRAAAKIRVASLYERRQDIGELAQTFALQAGADIGVGGAEGLRDGFLGLTRRTRADVEVAVLQAQEVSVRRLREVIRDAVFTLAADGLPDAIESADLQPFLHDAFSFNVSQRDTLDQHELTEEFDGLVARNLLQNLSAHHHVSQRALNTLVQAIRGVIDDMNDKPRNYRNVVERTNRLAKVALWLVSGAGTQAEFRRFFGGRSGDMPTKSVAHQVYYEVFPKAEPEREVWP